MALDRIDRAILGVLAKDARITNKDLAAGVGLSESACLERVRRLVANGAIRGFHADVDPAVLGVGVQAMVAIRLRRHTRRAVTSFERRVLALQPVVALHHLTGATDFLAHIVARDMDDLRDFTLDAITGMPEVARVETSLLFSGHRSWTWPDLTEP